MLEERESFSNVIFSQIRGERRAAPADGGAGRANARAQEDRPHEYRPHEYRPTKTNLDDGRSNDPQ